MRKMLFRVSTLFALIGICWLLGCEGGAKNDPLPASWREGDYIFNITIFAPTTGACAFSPSIRNLPLAASNSNGYTAKLNTSTGKVVSTTKTVVSSNGKTLKTSITLPKSYLGTQGTLTVKPSGATNASPIASKVFTLNSATKNIGKVMASCGSCSTGGGDETFEVPVTTTDAAKAMAFDYWPGCANYTIDSFNPDVANLASLVSSMESQLNSIGTFNPSAQTSFAWNKAVLTKAQELGKATACP